jgi:RES domain-containing protein
VERVGTAFDAHAGNVIADHRYSGPGFGAVYGADSPETALAEVLNYGSPAGKVSVSKDVRLGNVLDLTDPSTLRQLNVTTGQITGESYKITQQLGNMARSNGYDGILAPSARRAGGTNLVIFPR